MLSLFFTAMLYYAIGFAGWKILKFLGLFILSLFGFGFEWVDPEDLEEDEDEKD